MKAINLTDILVYYDGIQVFAAADAAGRSYVGVGYGPDISTDCYLVTAARPERLQQFRSGLLDLRSLLLEAPDGEWFITVDKEGGDTPFILEPQPGPVAQSPYLPGPNFILDCEPVESLAEWQEPHPAAVTPA